MSKYSWLVALSMVASPVAASANEQTAPQTAEAPKEKLICKKQMATGSLVKVKKVCLTARQWRGVNDHAQDQAREMQTLVSTESGR